MSTAYPGYDVLQSATASPGTRPRVAPWMRASHVPREPRFFTPPEWLTLCALCDRIIPQPQDREAVPLAAHAR